MVYLKKGLRPPAVLVAEKYWRVVETERLGEKAEKYWRVVETEQLGEKEMEDGDGQTGEKVLRDWVKEVKVCGRRFFRLSSALGNLEGVF